METKRTAPDLQSASAPADIRVARLATPRGFEPPIRPAALGRGTENADPSTFESVGDENKGSLPPALSVPSHLTGSPVARHMERSGRTDTPARSCVACNAAPATHIVSLANEPKVPTGILPNLCLNCACVRAEEKQIERLTADANRVNGAVKPAPRHCARCRKLLAPTSPNTRHDIDMHRTCYAAEQDEIAATRVLAPEQGSPLAGLIGVGR